MQSAASCLEHLGGDSSFYSSAVQCPSWNNLSLALPSTSRLPARKAGISLQLEFHCKWISDKRVQAASSRLSLQPAAVKLLTLGLPCLQGIAPLRALAQWTPVQAQATANRVSLVYVAESQEGAAYVTEWDELREAGVSGTAAPRVVHEVPDLLPGAAAAGEAMNCIFWGGVSA